MIVSCIGVFFTLVGVFVACKINDSVQAAACTKMYFSREMLCAIRKLFEMNVLARKALDEQNGKKKLPWTRKEDEARRLVKSYFQLAYELRYKRFLPISESTLRQICDVDALKLYFNTVKWMEWRLNHCYNDEPFIKLEKACRNICEKKRIKSREKEEPKISNVFAPPKTFMTEIEVNPPAQKF